VQHNLDYDRAWAKVSKKFWRRRRRELAIHIGLFMVVQLVLFVFVPVGVLAINIGYRVFGLVDANWVYIPWMSIFWGIVLLIHLAGLIGAALTARIFRYNVERELLRDFARANRMDEKRKNRPSYNELDDQESGFVVIDEADEAAYRQSARSAR
jgi:hypothetical protein